MQKQNNTPEEILEAIKSAKNILTCMDNRFDFDALSSCLAMNRILKKLGKTYTVTYESDIPKNAKSFLDTSPVKERTHPNTLDFKKYDLMIFLDTGKMSHIAKESNANIPDNLPKIEIDHHASNDYFGNLNFIDSSCPSTCSVLLKLCKQLGIELDKELALYLFVGIIFDTGFFQFNNVRPQDLLDAGELMKINQIDYTSFLQKVRFNETMETAMLKQVTYKNFVYSYKKRYAYSLLTLKALDEHGINDSNVTIAPADIIKYIDGFDFVFVVKELQTPKLYNISLRSHELSFDVASIAEKLGGGGHKVAAGANITAESVEEAIVKVLSAADRK